MVKIRDFGQVLGRGLSLGGLGLMTSAFLQSWPLPCISFSREEKPMGQNTTRPGAQGVCYKTGFKDQLVRVDPCRTHTAAALTSDSTCCAALVLLGRSSTLTITDSFESGDGSSKCFLTERSCSSVFTLQHQCSSEFQARLNRALCDPQDYAVIPGFDMNSVLNPRLSTL